MDGIFGRSGFQNEVVWKRTYAHNRAKRWGPIHDIILFYTKGRSLYVEPCFAGLRPRLPRHCIIRRKMPRAVTRTFLSPDQVPAPEVPGNPGVV